MNTKWQVGTLIVFIRSTVNTAAMHLFYLVLLNSPVTCFLFCGLSEMVPRSGGGDSGSTVIKLDTVRAIAEKVSRC